MIGAGSAGADGAAASGWAAAAKMLTLGTLFGGPLTVGIAMAVLRVGPAAPVRPLDASHAAVATASPVHAIPIAVGREGDATEGAPNAALGAGSQGSYAGPSRMNRAGDDPVVRLVPLPREPALEVAEAQAPEAVKPVTPSAPSVATQVRWVRPITQGDLLAREAGLVAEGRSALRRGDAKRALAAIHTAQSLASHQLAPEELAVEIQCLRALGREREAVQAEVVLKVSYPESDLGR
jgi:hypothetical protein